MRADNPEPVPTPHTTLDLISGRANVVDPSPAPYTVPIAENKALYVLLLTISPLARSHPLGALVVTTPPLALWVIAPAYICMEPDGKVVPADTVPQEVSVPLVVRYFPLLLACAGRMALAAAFAVVWPVPPAPIARVPVWSLRAKDEIKTLAVPAAFPIHILPSAAFMPISPLNKLGVLEAV